MAQQQSTAITTSYDYFEDATLKTTQTGALVIQVDLGQSRSWAVGEIAALSETSSRLFRIDRKGNPFPGRESVAAYAHRYNLSKAQARIDSQGVYLYVTEIGAGPTADACAICGNRPMAGLMTSPRGLVCPSCYDRAEA